MGNKILEDLRKLKETSDPREMHKEILDDELMHYGTPRHSGRYPWGSGDTPYQHEAGLLGRIDEYKRKGLSEKEIALAMGYKSTTELRNAKSLAVADMRRYDVERAKSLKAKGYSNTKIGEIMGRRDTSIASLLNEDREERMKKLNETANFLKDQVDSKGLIDVGLGVNQEIGVTDTKMKTAIASLESQGYKAYSIYVEQMGNPGKKTTVKVLMKSDDMTDGEAKHYIYSHLDKIASIKDYQSSDGGETFKTFRYPESISSKRIFVRYDEDGGTQNYGVIELRLGVDDISLGNSSYAQVRIAVDGTHYIKGMAMYSDDIPKGYDIIVNSNKKSGTPLLDSDPDAKQVLKPMKIDKSTGQIDTDNPFGALIKAGGQSEYVGKDGKLHLRVINKLREEGDWDDYSKSLSPQMLAKQKEELIKRQLKLTYANKMTEFEEICSLTNPAVKKQLLESFADDCDASAVHLKAAALPRQSTKVLLPVTTLKDNEIYAPTYKSGEHVVLIRYPHGGIFEIPELVVNNTHPDAKKILGNAKDAVGINLNVASKLSGADFDGDTAVVIPVNSRVKITTAKSIAELQNFEPKKEYAYHEGMKVMAKASIGKEMGKISNLITDMTIKGAPIEDITKAVKHSMVVIDAHKHKLDYKQSERDNDIETLKRRYQDNGGATKKGYGGVSTLLSRSTSQQDVEERKMYYYSKATIDPVTGEKIYTKTGRIGYKGTPITEKSTKMAEAKDAFTLSSGTSKENAYATYANQMKALANTARKEYLATGKITYNADAAKTYAKEVDSLETKLRVAQSNTPKERMAQIMANVIVNSKKESNPDMDGEDLKKAKSQALAKARVMTGANKQRIEFTDKEWEAVQSGAIRSSKLELMLKNADSDTVKKLATPKPTTTLSASKQVRIKSLAASGATIAQIAEALGISTSTVSKYI